MSAETVSTSLIIYPESDGKPVGETDDHRQEIFDLIAALEEYFRLDPQVYISGNLMFYYEEGNPAAVVSPDVLVVRGIEKRRRRVYKLWQEHQPPVLVIEVSSRSTRLEDLGNKKALYALLGISEYVMFDPLAEYLKPPLQCFRLEAGEYLRVAPEPDGSLLCQSLGLRLVREQTHLALFDASSGRRLLSSAEQAAAWRAAEAHVRAVEAEARAAKEQARAAEERAAALEAELHRLRDQAGQGA